MGKINTLLNLDGMEEKNTADVIKNLINKDGGKVVKVDLFQNVLVIRASKDSKSQLDRFLQTGKKIGMIKNGRVEMLDGLAILSAVIDSSKSTKLKEELEENNGIKGPMVFKKGLGKLDKETAGIIKDMLTKKYRKDKRTETHFKVVKMGKGYGIEAKMLIIKGKDNPEDSVLMRVGQETKQEIEQIIDKQIKDNEG